MPKWNKGDPVWVLTYGPDSKGFYSHGDLNDERFGYVDVPYIGGIQVKVNNDLLKRRYLL